MRNNNPLIVEVTRGDMVESRHRGHCVVADRTGASVHAWGDGDLMVYPRSAIKPLQALALIETGAAEACQLSATELALAAASHSATPDHVDAVSRWLERMGLSEFDLECAGHDPKCRDADKALIRARTAPGALYNNCSGKHAGFLATALHMGEPTKGYSGPGHPVQQRMLAILSAMGGVDLAATPRGVDGCGIPVIGMPLTAMARALARMADGKDLDATRAGACSRIIAAMTAHPNMVAGPGRFDTVTMRLGGGAFVVKAGAEGVYAGIVPGLGLGVALKIADGAKRAAEVAMAAVLEHLGVLDPMPETPVLNAAQAKVGVIRMASDWPG